MEKRKKIPQRKIKNLRKTILLQIFLYLVYSAILKAAMVLEGQNFAHLHEKKNDFFLFQVLYYSPPQKKTPQWLPKHTKCWWFYVKKIFFFSLLFKRKNCTDFFCMNLMSSMKNVLGLVIYLKSLWCPQTTHTHKFWKQNAQFHPWWKKKSLSWPHKNNKKKHPFTYLWRDKKIYTRMKKKKESEIDF